MAWAFSTHAHVSPALFAACWRRMAELMHQAPEHVRPPRLAPPGLHATRLASLPPCPLHACLLSYFLLLPPSHAGQPWRQFVPAPTRAAPPSHVSPRANSIRPPPPAPHPPHPPHARTVPGHPPLGFCRAARQALARCAEVSGGASGVARPERARQGAWRGRRGVRARAPDWCACQAGWLAGAGSALACVCAASPTDPPTLTTTAAPTHAATAITTRSHTHACTPPRARAPPPPPPPAARRLARARHLQHRLGSGCV